MMKQLLKDQSTKDMMGIYANQKLLETLKTVRKIVNGEHLSLPQICVVGDQSSGKSSLLTSISGIMFPEARGTCTRCPCVVNLMKSDTFKIEVGSHEGLEKCEDFE